MVNPTLGHDEERMIWQREREVLKRRVRALERALERARATATKAEEKSNELEAWIFEERTRSSQRLATARAQCSADAIGVCVEIVKGQGVAVLPSAAAHAERLVTQHGGTLDTDGSPLKETLVCVFHAHGQPPPLSPAEALPAALACVDFAARFAPALAAKSRDTAEGLLRPLLNDVVHRVASNLHDVTDRIVRRGRDSTTTQQQPYTQLPGANHARNPFRDDEDDEDPDASGVDGESDGAQQPSHDAPT